MKGTQLCFHEAVMSNKTLSMIASIYLVPQYLIACDLPTSSHTAPRHNIRAEKLIFSFLLYSMLWIPCTTRLLMPTSSQSSLLILWKLHHVHIMANGLRKEFTYTVTMKTNGTFMHCFGCCNNHGLAREIETKPSLDYDSSMICSEVRPLDLG